MTSPVVSRRTHPMNKSAAAIGMRLLIGIALVLMGSALARADDFDGNWVMNANGWKFTLKLEQKGDSISGTMTGINNEQKSTVEGKVNGIEITFTRDNGQEYRGYLLADDPTGKANKLAIAGVFKAGDGQYGWYAER
jgi:hypothetical protein